MLHKKDMFGYAIVGLIVALFVVGLLGGSNVLNILPSSNYGYPAATPSVLLTATPTNGTAPLNVSFSVAVSGLYGSVTSVEWFFGNNVTGSTTGVNTTYIYKVAGTYTAHAVVTTTSSLYGNSTYPSNNVTISVFTGYAVTFTESGLASGTGWNVTLNNVTHSSTTGTITFTEVNGTYSYTVANVTGYTVTPSVGNVTVNGKAVVVNVTFTPVVTPSKYTVTFMESGLASGTSWSVTLSGKTQSSTTGTITFTEVNGTYSYTVANVSGYTVSPLSGSVTVNGKAVAANVTFTPTPKYTVTFTESGLASGTSWSVTLSGKTQSSTTGTITFTEVNGTYSYTVANVSGYTVSPLSGSVKVNGTNASVSVTFKSTTTTTATSSSTIILALTAIVIIAAIIIVVVAITRKKKTSEEGEEEETEETETEETPSEEEKPGNGGEEEQPSETSETDTTTTEQKE